MANQVYEHVSPNVNCVMGNKTWPVTRNSLDELKVCDICSKPIRLVKIVSPTLVSAAKIYSGGNFPLPPGMTSSVPGLPSQTLPQAPNPGLLEG